MAKDELQNMDRKLRKFLNIYQAFHTQGDVDRLYFESNIGGMGLINVEDSVDMEIECLKICMEEWWKATEIGPCWRDNRQRK